MSEEPRVENNTEHFDMLVKELQKEYNNVCIRSSIQNSKLRDSQDYASECTMVLEKILSFLADIYSRSHEQDEIPSSLIINHINSLRDDLEERDVQLIFHEPNSIFQDSDMMEPETVTTVDLDKANHIKKIVRFGLAFDRLDESTTIKERLKIFEMDPNVVKPSREDSDNCTELERISLIEEGSDKPHVLPPLSPSKINEDYTHETQPNIIANEKPDDFEPIGISNKIESNNIYHPSDNRSTSIQERVDESPNPSKQSYRHPILVKHTVPESSKIATTNENHDFDNSKNTFKIKLDPGLIVKYRDSPDLINLNSVESNRFLILELKCTSPVKISEFKINNTNDVCIKKIESEDSINIKFENCPNIVANHEKKVDYGRYILRINYNQNSCDVNYSKTEKDKLYILKGHEFPKLPENYVYRNRDGEIYVVKIIGSNERETSDFSHYICNDVVYEQFSCKEYVLNIIKQNPKGISITGIVKTLDSYQHSNLLKDRRDYTSQEWKQIQINKAQLRTSIEGALNDLEKDGLIESSKNGKYKLIVAQA